MILGFEVYYRADGAILGNYKLINLPPEVILSKRLKIANLNGHDLFYEQPNIYNLKIKGKRKKFKGYLIAESEYKAYRFLAKHGLSDDEIEIFYNHHNQLYSRIDFIKWGNKLYVFSGKANFGVLMGWKLKKDSLRPILIGWKADRRHCRYFYLHHMSKKPRSIYFRELNSMSQIPKDILETLKKGYIFLSELKDEKYDILPYPPYEVRYAVKLYAPSVVNKSKPEEPPPVLKSNFILKTFLITDNDIKILDVSPGVLKSIFLKTTGNIYSPSYPNPHNEPNYEEFWRANAGYLLFAKPTCPPKTKESNEKNKV